MADDFTLKWDATEEQLYGENPDTGDRVPVPFESVNTDEQTINQSITDPTGFLHRQKLVNAFGTSTPTAYFSGPSHGEGGGAFQGATLSPDGRVIFAPRNSSSVGIVSQLLDIATANTANR